MEVEKVFNHGESKLILYPENVEECADVLDCFREGENFVGECKRDPTFIYPQLILKKDST